MNMPPSTMVIIIMALTDIMVIMEIQDITHFTVFTTILEMVGGTGMERTGEDLHWQNPVGTGGRKEGEEERLLSTLGFRALSTN